MLLHIYFFKIFFIKKCLYQDGSFIFEVTETHLDHDLSDKKYEISKILRLPVAYDHSILIEPVEHANLQVDYLQNKYHKLSLALNK